jgi:phosphoglucosamine mutase
MLFGSSGIRKRYDRELACLALRVGSALAAGGGSVLLGIDTRTTSGILAAAVTAGLSAAGATVEYAGICPTPAVGFGARSRRAGCMVTASHNPEHDNGLKLFNPDGSSFCREQQDLIESGIADVLLKPWDLQGGIHAADAVTPYREAIEGKISLSRQVSAVLDCGNGAGSVITPGLLAAIGVRTTGINCNPAGRFARPSEPLEEHLKYMGTMIASSGADCGIAHDGDADRMVGFDPAGRMISGDRLMILFARYLGAEHVVTTVDASMAIEEVASVRRTAVGDSFVSRELLRWGEFGGEPSGAWIFPNHSYCPDGPYAAALFSEIVSEWDLAGELGKIPSYPVLRESFACSNPGEILTAAGAEVPTDGIRISRENGWYLVRASGTEKKIRITAEGRTSGDAKEMLRQGRELISRGKVLKGTG